MRKFVCKNPPTVFTFKLGTLLEVYEFKDEKPVEVKDLAAKFLSKKDDFEEIK